jgi:uncharacterized membrane protein YidH (DUF202 family)
MKKLISAMIHSMPDFTNVGAFFIFIMVLFAIMGLHQYNETFYNICRYSPTPNGTTNWPFNTEIEFQRICS